MATNETLVARAAKVIPAGVNSPVRAYGSVGGTPLVIDHAKGAFVTDVAGREYVDLVCGWGPALLGHSHPEVLAVVQEAVSKGLSFGTSTAVEAELAEEIIRRVPVIEQVRLVSTGTEATMTALRLARGVTGRDLIVKFAGCYHGHSDGLLAAAGSGLATQALPGSAGVPAAIAAQTIVLPYGDEQALDALFAERGAEIAAVITEAAPANMGLVRPAAGFNAGLTARCKAHGALLICDEVLTGFRTSAGGWWACEQGEGADWQADIYTFGKVIGGGMPVAALGASREIMEHLAPLGPVYQAGTLSGNPVACAAGLKTLQLADDAVYAAVDGAAEGLISLVRAELDAAGVRYAIGRAGSLFSVFWGDSAQLGWSGADGAPANEAEVKMQDTSVFKAFFHAMLDNGVMLPPSAFEAWFVSAAHDASVLDRIASALPVAARAAAVAQG